MPPGLRRIVAFICMASHWLRFEWDLSGVPQNADEIPSPLVVRDATKEEEAAVLKVIASSFSMDTGWADIHKPLLAKLTGEVEKAFEDKETPSCIVLQYGNRIIGCSVLNLDESAENHLVTGPCVLHEYRSRSMGSGLLGASLLRLRKAGLRKAYGITRIKTIAARFLYPKFAGKSAEWVTEFEATPKLAA